MGMDAVNDDEDGRSTPIRSLLALRSLSVFKLELSVVAHIVQWSSSLEGQFLEPARRRNPGLSKPMTE
jgi:hypothetical protein